MLRFTINNWRCRFNHKKYVSGVFIINMLCRKQELTNAALAKIRAVFPYVYTKKLPEEDNEVVFALHKSRETSLGDLSASQLPDQLVNSLKYLQDVTQKKQKAAASKLTDQLSLTDQLEGLKLA